MDGSLRVGNARFTAERSRARSTAHFGLVLRSETPAVKLLSAVHNHPPCTWRFCRVNGSCLITLSEPHRLRCSLSEHPKADAERTLLRRDAPSRLVLDIHGAYRFHGSVSGPREWWSEPTFSARAEAYANESSRVSCPRMSIAIRGGATGESKSSPIAAV